LEVSAVVVDHNNKHQFNLNFIFTISKIDLLSQYEFPPMAIISILDINRPYSPSKTYWANTNRYRKHGFGEELFTPLIRN